jgi:hypothetical protein
MTPMKHPIWLALGAGLLVLVAAFAAPLWHLLSGAPPAVEQGLPWQTRPQPDGLVQVFGLTPGRDTLADVQARLGEGLQVALVARLGEVGVLEALNDPYAAGFVSGRLVLAFDVSPAALQRWRARAARSEPMEDGVRRFELQAADRDEARNAVLAGISFVPAVKLQEADVRQRFGPPAAERDLPAGERLLLYPDRGLAASVGAGQRGVLQYVAPRDFEARLGRQPDAPAAASAAAR